MCVPGGSSHWKRGKKQLRKRIRNVIFAEAGVKIRSVQQKKNKKNAKKSIYTNTQFVCQSVTKRKRKKYTKFTI